MLRSFMSTGLTLVAEAAMAAATNLGNGSKEPVRSEPKGPTTVVQGDTPVTTMAPVEAQPEPAPESPPPMVDDAGQGPMAPPDPVPAAAEAQPEPEKGPDLAAVLAAMFAAKDAKLTAVPAKAKIKCATPGCNRKFRRGVAPLLPTAEYCLHCTNVTLLKARRECYVRRTVTGAQMLCQNEYCNNQFPLEPEGPGSKQPRACCSKGCWHQWSRQMRPVIEMFMKEPKAPEVVTVSDKTLALVHRSCAGKHGCGKRFVVRAPLPKAALLCLDCGNRSRMERGLPPFLFTYVGEEDLTACQNPNHTGDRLFQTGQNEFGDPYACCSAFCNASWRRAGNAMIASFVQTGELPKITVIGDNHQAVVAKQAPKPVAAPTPVAAAHTPAAATTSNAAAFDLNKPSKADIEQMLADGTLDATYPENMVEHRAGEVGVLVITPNGKQIEFVIKVTKDEKTATPKEEMLHRAVAEKTKVNGHDKNKPRGDASAAPN